MSSATGSARGPATMVPRGRGSATRRRALGGIYGRNARAVMQRSWMATKNATWLVIVTGFAEPVLYLASMGYGLGAAIGDVPGPGGVTMSYAAYIAPSLLAVSAMNGAQFDTNNMFFKLNFSKLYKVMLFTSLGPLDVALGEISMALLRGLLYAVGFFAVAAIAGLVTSWWALLMIPGAVLIAFSFAALFMGIVTFLKRFQHLDWLNIVVLPLMLFSGTFFPIDVYPQAVQDVIMALPLWHGVDMLRQFAVGHIDASTGVHVAYFVVMGGFGVWLAASRLRKLFLR